MVGIPPIEMVMTGGSFIIAIPTLEGSLETNQYSGVRFRDFFHTAQVAVNADWVDSVCGMNQKTWKTEVVEKMRHFWHRTLPGIAPFAAQQDLLQLVGLREKLQENPIFHGKIYGFL